MDSSANSPQDVNRGPPYFIACWAIMGACGLTLAVRYCLKTWLRYFVPKPVRPVRVWGLEDLCYLVGFGLELVHAVFIYKSAQAGLGRHIQFLTDPQVTESLKWLYLSAPIAVTAATLFRTGVILFLYTCLSHQSKKLKWYLISVGCLQVLLDIGGVITFLVQCGPVNDQSANRLLYVHYLWDPTPDDGSIQCLDPYSVTTWTIVVGAFNCFFDVSIMYLAGYEVWRFVFQSLDAVFETSWLKRVARMDAASRNRRILQTVVLCGPLLASTTACVVRLCFMIRALNAIDWPWEFVPVVLLYKIENCTIPTATSGTVILIFIRTLQRRRDLKNDLSKNPLLPTKSIGSNASTSSSADTYSAFAPSSRYNGSGSSGGPTFQQRGYSICEVHAVPEESEKELVGVHSSQIAVKREFTVNRNTSE